jgi:hypothetical protein
VARRWLSSSATEVDHIVYRPRIFQHRPVGRPETSDCGGPSAGEGVAFPLWETNDARRHQERFVFDFRPVLYYCPAGIAVDGVGDKHADVEHLAGDWWIDWQDD